MTAQAPHDKAFASTRILSRAWVVPCNSHRDQTWNRRNNFFDCAVTCPRCGRSAEVIPGVYDAGKTVLNVLIDKSVSSEALVEIQRIAEKLQSGQISIEEAQIQATKLSPKFGKLFDIYNWPDQAKATLYAAIIAATTAIIVTKPTSTPNLNVTIQPVVERIIERKSELMTSSAPGPVVPLPKPRPPGVR